MSTPARSLTAIWRGSRNCSNTPIAARRAPLRRRGQYKMQVFARRDLAANAPEQAEEALLLEGFWSPPAASPAHWSLDEAIDERHGWIDRAAADLAARLGDSANGEIAFAYLNALSLRYYLVKLLRVTAFFDQVQRPGPCSAI